MTRVFTLHDEHYAPIAAETSASVVEFCARHSHVLHARSSLLDPKLPASWNKLAWILEHAKPEDTVIWFDADVLCLTPDYPLHDQAPQDGICFSSDNDGLCTGAFVSRGQWSLDFFKAVLTLEWADGQPRRLMEQGTVKALAEAYPKVSSMITLMSQAIILNPDSPFNALPFAAHFWANGWEPAKLATLIRNVRTTGWSSDRLADMRKREK